MRKSFLILCGFLLLNLPVSYAGEGNPGDLRFGSFNTLMDFNTLNVDYIKNSSEQIIASSRDALKLIYAVPKESRTYGNTLLAIDDMYNLYSNVASHIYLMANVHTDAAIRDQARASLEILEKFENEIGLDEELYRSVKEYAASAEAKKLTGYKKRYLDETVRGFERNGFALSKEKRVELKAIQDKLSELGIAFNNNIASSNDFLIVEEKDMDGCPEDFKKARKQEDGTYKIDMSYPSYSGFMKAATSEPTRKALYMKYNNRAVDKNLDVLNEMISYRQKMATLLGYKTFAQYQVEERMAKKPSNVWDFENKTLEKVKAKAQKDYQELLATKRNYLKDNSVQVVNTWESSFYNNILLKEKYQLDQDLVKEYFEVDHVIDGLFQIAQHLFDVKFVQIKDASVWQKDVRAFEVRQNDKVIGRFFLDLHPRANKYNHAACFNMIRGKATANGYQIPTATLVCNFPQATADQPGLMYHSLGSASVETFFHEFGHVLHNMLTTSELYSYAGTGVARDFVEAPSQIFENWAWNYDAVKMFAKHYKTGEVLPKDLFDKMVAAKNVGSGIGAAYQIYYGMLDMTLHDGFDPNGKETTTDVVKRLQNKITPFQYVDGTHFQAAFGHLNGYAAGYYGYLWAEVYAADMFSIFEKNGIMDQKTGKKYRDIILAKGGTEDPLELVKQFLGREPNQDAFLRSLGL